MRVDGAPLFSSAFVSLAFEVRAPGTSVRCYQLCLPGRLWFRVSPFVASWVDLQGTVLSEAGRRGGQTPCHFTQTWDLRKKPANKQNKSKPHGPEADLWSPERTGRGDEQEEGGKVPVLVGLSARRDDGPLEALTLQGLQMSNDNAVHPGRHITENSVTTHGDEY